MSTADEAHNRETLIRLGTMLDAVFIGAVVLAHDSIKEGSPLTGAPGQPVDAGNLRNSWLFEFDDPTHPKSAVIGTAVEYAEPIEDGVGRFGPLTLRSAVGGFHSVHETVVNFDRILEESKRRFAGGAPPSTTAGTP